MIDRFLERWRWRRKFDAEINEICAVFIDHRTAHIMRKSRAVRAHRLTADPAIPPTSSAWLAVAAEIHGLLMALPTGATQQARAEMESNAARSPLAQNLMRFMAAGFVATDNGRVNAQTGNLVASLVAGGLKGMSYDAVHSEWMRREIDGIVADMRSENL